ncbi:MAG: HAMP domain-containing sensor histidine kinase [Lentimicrobiaceae bacterium]|nr:HAMP domain-containing sensor histidine kinase [Lentimicrobiaceae bacterium]
MKNKKIRIIITLGAVFIVGVIVMQALFISKEWRNQEHQFVDKVTVSLQNVANQIYKINNSQPTTHNPVHKVNSNYYVIDLNSNIDKSIIEQLLKIEFSKNNVNSDYEYAIYNCVTKTMEYGAYFDADGTKKISKKSYIMPLYDDYELYFGVYFPKHKNYVFSNMYLWFFLLVVILTAIWFFLYSLWVILKQKKMSELQKDFINNMTHEFKTPISAVLIASDVLSDHNKYSKMSTEKVSTYTNIIKQEASRLSEQVNKILQIATIDKKNIQLNLQKVNINRILRELSETIQAVYTVDIKLNLCENIPPIRADLVHAKNIFYNLIDNAAKYSGENAIVEISCARTDKKVEIKITDNGEGIPEEYKKLIFDKFFRIPSKTDKVKGYGLGLFYVKTMCAAHGWKIKLDSKLHEGTCFTIEIYLKNDKKNIIRRRRP